MKLRVRSSETKDTIRLEISSSASIRDLKTLIASSHPSAAAVSPDDIRLSLNRTDELAASDDPGGDTLSILGIASGDLVFFSIGSQHRSSGITNPEVTNAKQSELDDVKGAAVSMEPSLESSNKIEGVADPNAEMDVDKDAEVVEYCNNSLEGSVRIPAGIESNQYFQGSLMVI